MTKYFSLSSKNNHYCEIVFGIDTFRLEFTYNAYSDRYYLTLYKNNIKLISKLKIVWSTYNLFNSYQYKDVGELRIVSTKFEITNNRQQYIEISKDNILDAVFEWSYDG